MKKIFLILIIGSILITGCTQSSEPNQTNLPNPAAVYCEEQGYEYEIRTNPDGSQYGICRFPDGSECKGWAFYRGECEIGESKLSSPVIGTPNPAAIYCKELGYTYKIEKTPKGERGICVVQQGAEFKAWDFFKGKVGKEYSYCAKKGYDTETEHIDKETYSKEYAVCIQAEGKRIPMIELMEEEGEPLIDTESYTIGKDVKDKQIIGKKTLGLFQANNFQKSSIELGGLGQSPPSYFDWRNYNGEDWVTSVKDQAECGSCWAFSAVGATEAKLNIDYNNSTLDYDLSEQHLVSCDCPGDCNGGWHDVALRYIRDTGVADEDCFSYLGCKKWRSKPSYECTQEYPCDLCSDWQDRAAYITNYHYITNTQAAYKQALVDYGPLSIALDADGWSSYTGGIFVGSTSQANHAVVLVGYNDTGNYWIVKNSWADDWGENGYIRLSYENNPITTFDEVFAVEQTLKPIVRGTLQPYLITPTSPINATKNQFFNFSTGVKCVDGSCGDVSATLTLPLSQPTTCSEIWEFDCGANPDSDNTFDTCSNTAGNDEHIEEIYLDKSKLNFGEEINVKCEVMMDSPQIECGEGWAGDNLYIYYRNSPTGTWQKKHYVSQVYSCNSYSIKFVPDSVEGEHQVRCITGYQLSEGECGSGSYYDNDDANFFVYDHTSGKGKIPIDYGNPFYTISQNPVNCSNMINQSTCNQTWQVNATGDIGSNWLLYTIYDSNYKVIETKETEKINVTIIEEAPTEFISITLYGYPIAFGSLDQNTFDSPALGNDANQYIIRIDPETTINTDIYQKGDDFTSNGYTLAIGNMSWNTVDNTITSINMTNDYQDKVAENIANGTNITMYYWIDIPLQKAGDYTTTIYIKAVETGSSP